MEEEAAESGGLNQLNRKVMQEEKITRAKTQLELNLATAIKDNKSVSINTSATKGWLRRISIFYWI